MSHNQTETDPEIDGHIQAIDHKLLERVPHRAGLRRQRRGEPQRRHTRVVDRCTDREVNALISAAKSLPSLPPADL